jgi:transcriptional regulator GlxA family with amidase domain
LFFLESPALITIDAGNKCGSTATLYHLTFVPAIRGKEMSSHPAARNRVQFGILIYHDAEPIDLATFGVLSMARRIRPEIAICTIAPQPAPTILANGLRVIADFDLATAPSPDVLVVTGGPGWVAQSRSAEMLAFIRRQATRSPIVSVCTGGMILAASGLLQGKAATTKREVVAPETSPLELLRRDYSGIDVREATLVDEGSIITGGGVSLCIDTILHLLAKLFGPEMAQETARIMEYERAWAANAQQLPPLVIHNRSTLAS